MTLDLHKSGKDRTNCPDKPYAQLPLMLTFYTMIMAHLSKL